ncbi:hypothetical protein KZ872_31840, partial [Pseudomonas aeruginosa]|uniref:hypothetical protein n=1 Tax=Pseudomonas aeruginosa TaxID=287 RepID=UPI001CA5D043|nr:hypothetical protein [Pseudomonas aeruginosa]
KEQASSSGHGAFDGYGASTAGSAIGVAGARLAAAGEWRLAAILTDLAWLLRAYSQSVSSDGAQHGEKTS